MLSPMNITGYHHEPRDRTPIHDPDEVTAFARYAESLDYGATCKTYMHLRTATKTRPTDLSNSPVLHAWMAVLAIEASLLEYARAHGLGEKLAYRFFVRLRGDGIPRKPAWRLALERARAAANAGA